MLLNHYYIVYHMVFLTFPCLRCLVISKVSSWYSEQEHCAAPALSSGKGQLISKANCQAVNSSKKRTNEFVLGLFVFTTMRRIFVCFLDEIKDTKTPFEIT